MKSFFIIILSFVLPVLFVFPVAAAQNDAEQAWTSDLWSSIDSNTKELLGEVGIDGIGADDFLNMTPTRVFDFVIKVLRRELVSPVKSLGVVLLLVVFVSFTAVLADGNGGIGKICNSVGHMCILFLLLTCAGSAFNECMPAIEATKNFMLTLVPVFTGIIGFSGNPVTAAGWGAAILAFAEGVGVIFAEYIPTFGAFGAAICAASSLDPELDFSAFGKLINKTVTAVCGFVSCVFTALLSVKGIIAGAADTVGVKGLKFVIGQSIPIVGSAIGDALNSVIAGVGLIKNTVGVFALIAVIVINAVPLLRVILWKWIFSFLAFSCELIGNNRIKEVAAALNGVLSVLMCVICFNAVVFIIGIGVILVFTGR